MIRIYLINVSTIHHYVKYQTENALNVLLLIAHGSRKESANQEVRELAIKIENHSSSKYAAVIPAFLEFAQPDIGSGVDLCAKFGANNITVVPYFLSAGAHVKRDIPGQLVIASRRYPEINIEVTGHFGAVNGIVESVINCTNQSKEQ